MPLTKCFACLASQENNDQRMTAAKIDRQLSMDKDFYKSLIKVLLLGSGESGKSTFVKQMRIINGKHFNEDELKLYKLTVFSNIVLGMKVLIDATVKLNIGFSSKESSNNAAFVFSFDTNIKLEEPVFQQYTPAIQQLWKDTGVQAAYARRREFLLVCRICSSFIKLKISFKIFKLFFF